MSDELPMLGQIEWVDYRNRLVHVKCSLGHESTCFTRDVEDLHRQHGERPPVSQWPGLLHPCKVCHCIQSLLPEADPWCYAAHREKLFELGGRAPYHRYVNFPVNIPPLKNGDTLVLTPHIPFE